MHSPGPRKVRNRFPVVVCRRQGPSKRNKIDRFTSTRRTLTHYVKRVAFWTRLSNEWHRGSMILSETFWPGRMTPCANQLPEYGYCSCYDTNIPCEPLTTIPNEALTSTQTTGCSWPVRMARGEGWSPWERSKLTLVLTYAYNRRNLNKDSSRIWNSNPLSLKKKRNKR